MPRLGLGLGLNLPRPIFLGGGSPSVPVGALATYTAYSPSNFTLVTGNNVNEWNDETTNANNLTQGTSANQPKLVEDFTVTQFTASNQPTLIDDAGTWKAEFDTNDFMEGLKPQSGDFTYVFTGVDIPNYTTINSRFIGQLGVNTARFINLSGSFRIYDDVDTIVFQEPWNNESEIIVRLSGNTLSVFMNGTQLGSDTDVTGSTFTTLTTLGNSVSSINGTLQSLEIYDVAVADVTNITETAVQTFTADPLKMRTSANANPTDGQDVAKWYADEFSAYRDARVVFDPDDYMEGLPPQAGDFTYVFTGLDYDNTGTARFLMNPSVAGFRKLYFQQASGGQWVTQSDDNVFHIVNKPIEKYETLIFRNTGGVLELFGDGALVVTFPATTLGKSFTITDVGYSASSINGETATLNVYDRALTQEEMDYFFYLRNADTGEILTNAQGEPLLPS